jgi:PAS domain S-box-containing protein
LAEAGEADVTDDDQQAPAPPPLARQFDALLDAIPDTLVLISPELRVLWCNRAAAAKLGVTSREIVGRRCHEIWHRRETPCAVCPVQVSYVSGRPEVREVISPDGMVWDLRTAPVRGPGGEVAGVIEVARDISEQRRLEEHLAHAQKLESIGRLAGGIAHDFNNYLAAIAGFTELALHDLPEGARAREQVEQAREAALRAGGVTRQLLAFSRREPMRKRSLDLRELLASRSGLLQQLVGDGTTIQVRTAADLGPVDADPVQIEQILANLVVNAHDAMSSRGTVTIEAANRTVADADAGGKAEVAPGEYVALSVSDTGVGMAAEALQHLFEPFFTTKPSGTGLGLATVYGIARRGGGDVLVQSAPGKGTRIEVLLPRASTPPAVADEAAPARQARGTETVLVVEDRSGVRRVTVGILKLLGYTVLEAADGAEALSRSSGHAGAIDLLLTDVAMPGIGGAELARLLLLARPGLRVLYMTGFDPSHAEGDVSGHVAGQTLLKPFTAEALGRAVREALDGGQGRAAAERVGADRG